jgi:hypothetical protein
MEPVGAVTGPAVWARAGRAAQPAASGARAAPGPTAPAAGKLTAPVGELPDDEETEAEGRLQQQKGDMTRAG